MLPEDCYKIISRKLPDMNFTVHGSKQDLSQLWITCDCMDDDFTLAYPITPNESLVETVQAMVTLARSVAAELAQQELDALVKDSMRPNAKPFWLQ